MVYLRLAQFVTSIISKEIDDKVLHVGYESWKEFDLVCHSAFGVSSNKVSPLFDLMGDWS